MDNPEIQSLLTFWTHTHTHTHLEQLKVILQFSMTRQGKTKALAEFFCTFYKNLVLLSRHSPDPKTVFQRASQTYESAIYISSKNYHPTHCCCRQGRETTSCSSWENLRTQDLSIKLHAVDKLKNQRIKEHPACFIWEYFRPSPSPRGNKNTCCWN